MPETHFLLSAFIAVFLGTGMQALAQRYFPSLRNEECPVCEASEFRVVDVAGQSKAETYYRCSSCGVTYRNGVLQGDVDSPQ